MLSWDVQFNFFNVHEEYSWDYDTLYNDAGTRPLHVINIMVQRSMALQSVLLIYKQGCHCCSIEIDTQTKENGIMIIQV